MSRARLFAALLWSLAPAAVSAAPASVTEVHYVMGTYFRITAEHDGGADAARTAMRRCFQETRRLEGVFSRFDPASELNRLNAAAGAPWRVSADVAALLRRATALRTATGGAFDVSVGPLTELWRRRDGGPTAPEVAAARALVGRARLDGDRLTLAAGARLDFDGIAKGWAVDRCVALLRAGGVGRALVSLGESSLYGLGAPRGKRWWTLTVRGPAPDEVAGVLRLRDRAASVSATFGGLGRQGGARVGHIVDPHTGRPLDVDAAAVVVAASATDAEAFSKALLLWGAAGAARVERLGATGAVHVESGAVHEGPGARRSGCFAAFRTPMRLAAAAGATP